MSWNLDDYEPVDERLAKFWDDHQTGRVLTDLLAHDDGHYIVKALVWKDATTERPDASGLAEETTAPSGVNKTSALENCETSAIGRALANLGYAAKGRASREEMEKVGRGLGSDPGAGAHYSSHSNQPARGKYNCPACGSQVWDNTNRRRDEKDPVWKCSNDSCQGGGPRKKGDGNWPWASWEEDPGDAGLIGPPPVRDDFEPRDDIPPDEAPF